MAMLAGATGEWVMQLGVDGAAHMLGTDPAGFFATPCVSPEDLVMPSYDPNTCARLVKSHRLIERLAHALPAIRQPSVRASAMPESLTNGSVPTRSSRYSPRLRKFRMPG